MVIVCLHTQYCNGGDLADYLQGKHQTNLSHTHTSMCTFTQIIVHQSKLINAAEEEKPCDCKCRCWERAYYGVFIISE